MIRYLIPSLSAAVLLAAAATAPAQFPPPPRAWGRGDDICGTYVNTSNGGMCQVSRRGRDYVFVNENGTAAGFAYSGPGQLRLVWGDWNPDVVATLTRDRSGRPAIRFQEPGNPAGLWVRQD
jgi:hypothetical protein